MCDEKQQPFLKKLGMDEGMIMRLFISRYLCKMRENPFENCHVLFLFVFSSSLEKTFVTEVDTKCP